MPAYISARFEKTNLTASGQVRVVLRNLDQGDVPPAPSPTYFPTQPSTLRDFIVGEYVNDVVGERFKRVAVVADVFTLTASPLNVLESTTVDFIAAGVTAGSILEITLPDPTRWTSEEYPTGNPFRFSITSVLSATQIRVAQPFPAFAANLAWAIPAYSLTNSNGVTRRTGLGPSPVEFLDRRFNAYFSNAVSAENFVSAAKASMDALANEGTGSSLTNENYTASPS